MTAPGDRMLPELLPCPFCGGAAEIDEFRMAAWMTASYGAGCEQCQMYFAGHEKPERAAAAWNRRATLRAGGVWVPVGERLPEEGEYVLVNYPIYSPGNSSGVPDRSSVFIAYRDKLGWDKGYWRLHETPTHWMPLPSPPMLAAVDSTAGGGGGEG